MISDPVTGTLRSLLFLVKGPVILVMLFVINWMTSPGQWWVQWAALGIGIAWVLSFFRVLRALVLAGGLAALIVLLYRHFGRGVAGPGTVFGPR